jgi:ABC-2 type transport system permease protein
MHGFVKIVWVQLKLLFREPPAFFFTLVFPSILLLFFGSVFGNTVDPESYRKYGYVDGFVSALIGLVIATTGLMGIPISTAFKREGGTLRRFRATPLRPSTYLAADVVSHFLTTLGGVCGLLLLGTFVFHLRFGGSWLNVAAAFVLSTLSFFASGYVIASLAATGRMAQAIGQAIFFPMMFLSGASIPVEIMPEGMRRASQFLPLTHAIALLRGMWFGEAWGEHVTDIVVLLVMGITGVVVSARVFRWE